MPEYIEREAIEKWILTQCASFDTEQDRECVVERIKQEIPSADVQPVKHGKWIDVPDKHIGIDYQCSVCKKTHRTAKQYDLEGNEYVHKYCPNCGARMTE